MTLFPGILFCITILFGTTAMILLLDIPINRLKVPEKLVLLLGIFIVCAINFTLSFYMPMEQQSVYYILLVHLPSFLIFWYVTKISAVKILFSLFTAVFLIFPATVLMMAISRLTLEYRGIFILLSGIGMYIAIILATRRFIKPEFNYLIKNYSNANILKMCALPFIYYISNYYLGKYSFTSTMKTDYFLIRILIFCTTFISYILILDISKSAREKHALLNEQMLLTSQLEYAKHQINTLYRTQQQSAIYRHDLRHHLSLLGGLVEKGDMDKIKDYLAQVQSNVDTITPIRFCNNETVNLILSSFDSKSKKAGVTLFVEANLPQELAIADTELCAVFSNGFENALAAASQVEDAELRTVRVSCSINRDKLLILIQNAYNGKVEMENGIPVSSQEGHGFGCRSIAAIAEKRSGFSTFKAQDGIFTLRVVLPMDL